MNKLRAEVMDGVSARLCTLLLKKSKYRAVAWVSPILRPYSVTRAIAAVVLLFLVLGLLFTNAKSTSHELIEQLPHADSSHHAQSGDHDPEGSAASEGAGHSHEHDPTDHTHDIPLRFLLAAALPAFMQNWEALPTAVLHSIPSFLLERPPKLLILA